MTNNCLRCGYTWSARSAKPMRCPHCKSTRWNVEVIKDQCLRCGAEWIQRSGEVPKYCPICHSSMWNKKKQSFTCPKCGKTRMLRSNSRMDLCPSCDLYAEHRNRNSFEDLRSDLLGISKIVHLWRDGDKLTLCYADNGNGIAFLLDCGKLIGEINIETWCRNNNISFDISKDLSDEVHQKVFEDAVKKIFFMNEISEAKTSKISTLRGLEPKKAEVVYLHNNGMTPVSIAMKTGIPFCEVIDILNSVPDYVNGSDLKVERNPEFKLGRYNNQIRGTERT